MRIAVIGGGIAGLGCAWLLRERHTVTLYEREALLGGHSNTVEVETHGRRIPVDTGFIVCNDRNYPNLLALFDRLGIATESSDMSFAVSIGGGALEYSGTNLVGLFAQKRNLLRPRFHRMVRDILRFYREARHALAQPGARDETLGAFLTRGGYSPSFLYDHLLPMGAAIWSTPVRDMLEYPFLSFARFCDNHGLLSLTDRPRWRTVTGGSRRYVTRLAADLAGQEIRHHAAAGVRRLPTGGVEVRDASGETRHFDQVVLACHGDTALALLEDADPTERRLLGAFRFQPNRAWLHSDPALMPRRRRVWASWNYLSTRTDTGAEGRDDAVAVTYWMNQLQNLGHDLPLFVTLNPPAPPRGDLVHGMFDYDHPLFDRAAVQAQGEISAIQGARATWFAGAWLGYGFHEDGLKSGIAVAQALGAAIPWATEVAPAGRLRPPAEPAVAAAV